MDKSGFSLLEVLIAITIITIGLVAVLSLIANSLASYRTSSQSVIDINITRACLENARNERDKTGVPTSGDPEPEEAGDHYKIFCDDIIYYLYKWQ